MINFPSLGLSFKISNIAFSIFGIDIFWYAIFIIIGIIVGLCVTKYQEKNFNISFEYAYSAIIYALIFGILGARIYYILFNLDLYTQNPLKIFAFRDGGLAIYGGLIFGSIAIIVYSKIKHISFLKLFDYIVAGVAIAQSIGRWGNFFNQEAYGIQTNNFFRMGLYTINGYIEVHPTFLYESVCTFIICIILIVKSRKLKYNGELCLLYLFLYSGVRMVIEELRSDSLMIGYLKVSQVLSIAIFVISGWILLKNKLIYNKKQLD